MYTHIAAHTLCSAVYLKVCIRLCPVEIKCFCMFFFYLAQHNDLFHRQYMLETIVVTEFPKTLHFTSVILASMLWLLG